MPQSNPTDTRHSEAANRAQIGAEAPNPDLCRARPVTADWDVSWCLVEPHPRCPHAQSFGFKQLCFHPQREQIVARTLEERSPLRTRKAVPRGI